MDKLSFPVFDKVLFVAPEWKGGKGGMSSVIASYRDSFTPFHIATTNSGRGLVSGLVKTLLCSVDIPVQRLAGRKIAHFHYASGKSWQRKKMLMAWARLWGYKIVTHCHGAEFRQFVERAGKDKIKNVLDKAAVNIVLSDSWKRYFTDTLNVRGVTVVNNIVGRPKAAPAADSSKRGIRFLFLGFLGDRKGIFDILNAIASLKDKGYEFTLTVGGNGETERFENEVKRLGLDDVVDYKGWIAGDDKDCELALCDVLMLPSHNEGLPICILEAMANGKAVIASPVGGIPEIIKDGVNGLLVEAGNVAEIEKAMEAYLTDPDLAARHGGASASIVDGYFPESVGRQLAGIYEKILKG